MNKKRISQIIALVVVLSMVLTTAAFAMPPGHFKQLERTKNNYENAANYMKNKGIIKGYGGNNFGFEDYVKRGDITVMIVRAFKISTLLNEYEESFGDVNKDDYFYDAILTAKKFGIAKGDGKNFNPNKMVTIEEAIWLIQRSVAVANSNVETKEVDLMDLFNENELNKPATRQDIALMLYYVLAGENYVDEENENSELEMSLIEYELDEEGFIDLDSEDFETAFAHIGDTTNEELEYVKFILPIRNSKLYYDYDVEEDRNSLVTQYAKYYVDNNEENEISNITFVPNDNFSGTIYIKYMAYDMENSYPGLIKITVNGEKMLKTLSFEIDENTLLNFKLDDFEGFIDEVIFVLPDDKVGLLYNDTDHDNKAESDELLEEDEEIGDEDFDDIIFVPFQDFTGKIIIEYTAYDEDNSYSGEIKIEVQEVQEIATMKLTMEDNEGLDFNFVFRLENLVDNEEIFSNLNYVMFQLPEQGKLSIKYDEDDAFEDVDNIKYDIDNIYELNYESEGEGSVTIKYTAFDGSKEYDGVIRITVE